MVSHNTMKSQGPLCITSYGDLNRNTQEQRALNIKIWKLTAPKAFNHQPPEELYMHIFDIEPTFTDFYQSLIVKTQSEQLNLRWVCHENNFITTNHQHKSNFSIRFRPNFKTNFLGKNISFS